MKEENKYSFDGDTYDLLLKVWAEGHRGRQYRGMQKEFFKSTPGVSASSIDYWKQGHKAGKWKLEALLKGFGLTWQDRHWLIADSTGPQRSDRDKIDEIYKFIKKLESSPNLFIN